MPAAETERVHEVLLLIIQLETTKLHTTSRLGRRFEVWKSSLIADESQVSKLKDVASFPVPKVFCFLTIDTASLHFRFPTGVISSERIFLLYKFSQLIKDPSKKTKQY